MTKHLLLAGSVSAAALLIASGAWAADAAASAPTAAADAAASIEEVVVYGQGETRQTQTLHQPDILIEAPGTSPIKVLATLPGVNFQSADPFGAYEWSARISIRGFNQNQLGFTLDGVPLGDMSYGNYNGLHISRAISSENIGRVELAQGTGALDTASSSNLGGTVQFYSIAPRDRFGVFVEGTLGGNDNTMSEHGFVRLDSGELAGGGRGFVSYGYQDSDKWKGDGAQRQHQVNAKWVQPVGPATVTAWVNYSDRRENDYQDLSLSLIKHDGYSWDNISNNWPLAVQIAKIYDNQQAVAAGGAQPYPGAGVVFPSPIQTVDDTYFNASGLRKDLIGALSADWEIVPNLKLKLTGYGHHNQGQGLWFTPYVPSPDGTPISIRTTEYDINREGAIGSLSYEIANNTIEGGFWFENNNFNQARRFYGLDSTGTNRDSLSFQSDPFFTQWAWKFNTKTYDFHLQDTWQIMDALKLNFGFKSLQVDVQSSAVAGTAYADQISSKDNFLPQVGFNWKVMEGGEVFGDYAENMRAFVGAATSGPFAASPVAFDAVKATLKPETSQTFELGYRFHSGAFQGVLAGYYVKFDNRLLNISECAGIVGCFSGLANVGSVTSKGIEAAGTWRIAGPWSLTASYAFDDSTYDDDVTSVDSSGVATVTPTAGKTTVDTPKHIANAALNYDDGSFFGNVDLSYMSRRYYTYINDASVPGRALVDLSFGYRFHGGGEWLDGLEIQANVTNLFDKSYVSTIGSNGFVNSDPTGSFQTLLAGAPREAFITLRKQF